jgi:hypothetical protein
VNWRKVSEDLQAFLVWILRIFLPWILGVTLLIFFARVVFTTSEASIKITPLSKESLNVNYRWSPEGSKSNPGVGMSASGSTEAYFGKLSSELQIRHIFGNSSFYIYVNGSAKIDVVLTNEGAECARETFIFRDSFREEGKPKEARVECELKR